MRKTIPHTEAMKIRGMAEGRQAQRRAGRPQSRPARSTPWAIDLIKAGLIFSAIAIILLACVPTRRPTKRRHMSAPSMFGLPGFAGAAAITARRRL
jgi:hypothetical protein